MPVSRTTKEKLVSAPFYLKIDNVVPEIVCENTTTIIYPKSANERSAFRTVADKKVTPHQWAVYDCVLQIPAGKVTTYGEICRTIGEGTPRSVGTALRNNPFAPYVPCHRVVATDLTLGGFHGEKTVSKGKALGPLCSKKVEMLRSEGVGITADGKVEGKTEVLWRCAKVYRPHQ